MNPIPMNRGYRRLFWATLFILMGGTGSQDTFPGLPGLIGCCLAVSGAGIIAGTSGSARFKQARAFALAGAILSVLQWLIILPFFSDKIPWELDFLSYFLGAVIVLQIYVNVFMGAGELLGGGWISYYSKCATCFSGVFTLSTLGMMAFGIAGNMGNSPVNVILSILIALLLPLSLWTMWVLAMLRGKYPMSLQ